jgi:hypothetical protein
LDYPRPSAKSAVNIFFLECGSLLAVFKTAEQSDLRFEINSQKGKPRKTRSTRKKQSNSTEKWGTKNKKEGER